MLHFGPDEDSDDDEPEEVTQAWEDLMYLQKEKQRYSEMREKVEQEMEEVKKRSQSIEEVSKKWKAGERLFYLVC